MFENISPQQPQQPASASREPVDMYAEVDPGSPRTSTPQLPPELSQEMLEDDKESFFTPKKIGLILLGAVGVAGVVGGTLFIVNTLSQRSAQTTPPPSAAQVPQAAPLQPQNIASVPPPPSAAQVPQAAPVIIDTDGDGLNDGDEQSLYGTDPKLVDTDGDELSDREEVLIYRSNPLKQDTDGDTYPDGLEVRKGYDPNGRGKLQTLPQNEAVPPSPQPPVTQ